MRATSAGRGGGGGVQRLARARGSLEGRVVMGAGPKRIFVTGDFVWDHALLHVPENPATDFATVSGELLRSEPVGGWYLEELIRTACRGLGHTIAASIPRGPYPR